MQFKAENFEVYKAPVVEKEGELCQFETTEVEGDKGVSLADSSILFRNLDNSIDEIYLIISLFELLLRISNGRSQVVHEYRNIVAHERSAKIGDSQRAAYTTTRPRRFAPIESHYKWTLE